MRQKVRVPFEQQRRSLSTLSFFQKKYDAEKLTQDAEFLQREITEISSLINGINIEINDHTDIKNNLVR